MTITKTYDRLNRLLTTASAASAPATAYRYDYNGANQRTRATLVDGLHPIYNAPVLGARNRIEHDEVWRARATPRGSCEAFAPQAGQRSLGRIMPEGIE